MKNTKSTVLSTPLRLFNQQGLAQTTLRTIAQEMKISQGNLNYHFKKREDIVEALYFQLVAQMDVVMEESQQGPFEITDLYQRFRQTLANFYDYRFFMLDFVTVMRAHESIRNHYKQLVQLRRQQFQGILMLLIQKGIAREEEFSGEFENMELRLQIMADFWLSAAVVRDELNPEAVDRYAQIIFQSFYPYFTAKGKKAFLQNRI